MRRSLAWIVCLTLVLAGCPEVTEVAATQTTVQIGIDAELLAVTQMLRVRTAAQQGGSWVPRNDKSFDVEALKWPVEIVVLPRSEAQADEPFDVVVEALAQDGGVLAQARARSGFALRQQRTLGLRLSRCGARPFGFVCEHDPNCFGPTCATCVDASCVETPFTDPLDLPGLEPALVGDGGIDASLPSGDGGETPPDAEGGPDASAPDSATPDAPDAEGPMQCANGSEPDEAGVCADIDECARQLDDCDEAPPACMNLGSGLGFACACPSGYRGEGRGENGCADIDECMEQTHQCGMLVVCNNTPGNYSCGSCPAGYAPGTGGDCTDINECETNNGGCDTSPMAACNNVVGGPNTCTCPNGYAGDGKGTNGCVDVVECATNNGGCDTSPMATCNNVVGGPNTCTCPAGYAGDGRGASGCADVNECGSNNGGCDTSPLATCMNVAGAPNTCDCPDGYTGDGKGANGCVDVKDCTATSCMNGGTCVERVGGFGCECVSPFTGDRCELEICGTVTIRTRADVATFARCTEVTGNFNLQPDFADFTAADLPNLRIVRGEFNIGGQMNSVGQRVTFGALTTIGGRFTFAGTPQGFRELRFPALTTVGSASAPVLMQLLGNLSLLEMPELRNVHGDVFLSNTDLCTANFRRLQRVSGDFTTLSDFPHVPYSSMAPLLTTTAGTVAGLDGTPNIPIGCCSFVDTRNCNGYDLSVCENFTCR
jgi:hypothetical protein